jgi:hypothetical protein
MPKKRELKRKRKIARRVVAKASGPRFPGPVDRAANMAASAQAVSRFQRTAYALITQHRPQEEWTEAEQLGTRLANRLAQAFRDGCSDEWAPMLRDALSAFSEGDESTRFTLVQRRYFAVRTIHEWGTRWQSESARPSEEREHLLRECVRELALHDEAFEALGDSLDTLAERLAAFSPNAAGRKGAKSAERLLAEIIVYDLDAPPGQPDALGFAVREGEDEDEESAVERMRKHLAAQIDKHRNRA